MPNLMSGLRLRTKLLFFLVLTTACLSCGTLLVVRYSGEQHAQQEVVAGAHGWGDNDFKIGLAQRTVAAVLSAATRAA